MSKTTHVSYRVPLSTITVVTECASKECAHKSVFRGSAIAVAICEQAHTVKLGSAFSRSQRTNFPEAVPCDLIRSTTVQSTEEWRRVLQHLPCRVVSPLQRIGETVATRAKDETSKLLLPRT